MDCPLEKGKLSSFLVQRIGYIRPSILSLPRGVPGAGNEVGATEMQLFGRTAEVGIECFSPCQLAQVC